MKFKFPKQPAPQPKRFQYTDPFHFARMCTLAVHESRTLTGYFSYILQEAPFEGEVSDQDWLCRTAEEYAQLTTHSARSWTRHLARLDELGWIEKRVMHDEKGIPKLHVRITYEIYDVYCYYEELLQPYGKEKVLEFQDKELHFELRQKAQHRLKVNTNYKWYPPEGLVAPNAKIDSPFCVLPKPDQSKENG